MSDTSPRMSRSVATAGRPARRDDPPSTNAPDAAHAARDAACWAGVGLLRVMEDADAAAVVEALLLSLVEIVERERAVRELLTAAISLASDQHQQLCRLRSRRAEWRAA